LTDDGRLIKVNQSVYYCNNQGASLAAGCPIVKNGGTVDVYETINVM
jgi:hypothetical protein